MKLDDTSSAKLKAEIEATRQRLGLSFSEIGRIADVHASQVSRICRGEFRTLSHNVVQVCMALGLKGEGLGGPPSADEILAGRLKAGILELWDRTPEDAERLIRLLDQLADLRGRST